MSNLKIALAVAALVIFATAITTAAYFEWRSIPVCETIAEFGGQQRILIDGQWEWSREGMVTMEIGTGRCRVGKYLP
jgi:hypothetical protein